MQKLYYRELSTRLGTIRVASTLEAICCVSFHSRPSSDWSAWFLRHFSHLPEKASLPLLETAARQLQEYFARRRRVFDLPLNLRGTSFQLRVWEELLKIPYGSSVSYGGIAQRIGNPRGSRAVGAAAARNPVPIIVPCHRVIGGKGELVGFASGMAVKEQLLKLEGTLVSSFR